MTKTKKPIFNLDKEEKKMSDSFDLGEWESVKGLEKEIAKAQEAASRYLHKDARINIRISSSDLDRLKQIAAYEGLPYQTLISSVLHKYSAGHLNL
jgi:predicted DNA binding CopG/RHH family protein